MSDRRQVTEKILSQAKKVAEEAEVFTTSLEETLVKFEANQLKLLQTKQETSVNLRIVRQGKFGYAAATKLENGEELVTNAVETAQFGMPAEFQFPGLSHYPRIEVFDPAVESVSIEKMINLGEELITAVTNHTPGTVGEAGVTKGVISVRMINSRGGQANYRKSFFSLGIESSLIKDTDMLFVGESESSCHPLLDTSSVVKVVLRQLELAQNHASVPSRILPVVFTPDGVASTLIPSLMTALNGKIVLEGASPIGNRLGQKVFDETLSLRDDATLAYRPSSRPCDDEGTPSQRTPLIVQGIITNFLYDLQTAARAKAQSTGNGSRSHSGLLSPSPSAFIIAPGKSAFEDMVQEMKEGLVIEQLMGAEQGNVLGGDFSGNVLLGYKVANGEITGRVKNTMVSGNIYEILKEGIAIGNKAKWVGSSLQTPHIYCPRLSVATKD